MNTYTNTNTNTNMEWVYVGMSIGMRIDGAKTELTTDCPQLLK